MILRWREKLIANADTLAIGVFAFILLLSIQDHTYFTIFQERDLERGRLFAKGTPFFFGPELSGGGHLPGGFYYLLLALPLALGLGWQGAWLLMNALGAAAVAAVWHFLKKNLSAEAAFAGTLTLVSAPHFLKTFAYFQNFSFMPLLLVLALTGFGRAFALDHGGRRGWIVAGLTLGLAVQLHFSSAFFIGAGLFLQLAAPWLGLRRPSAKDFALGGLAFGAVLSPFVVWWTARRLGIELGATAAAYAGNFTLTSFEQSTAAGFGWGRVLRLLLEFYRRWVNEYVLLAAIPGLAALAAVFGLRKVEAAAPDSAPGKLFKVWLVCTLFALPPALTVIVAPHRGRYFTCLLLAFPLLLAAGFERERRRREANMNAVLAAAYAAAFLLGIFTIVKLGIVFAFFTVERLYALAALISALGFALVLWQREWKKAGLVLSVAAIASFSGKAREPETFQTDTGVTLQSALAAAQVIHEQTGWSWEEARERLLLVNFHYQRSMATLYREHAARSRAPAPQAAPDGFFVVMLQRSPARIATADGLRTFLMMQPLQQNLREGLRTGKIKLGPPRRIPYGVVASYTVEDKLAHPPHFQNVGVNYLEAGVRVDRRPATGPSLVERPQAQEIRLTFNDCPNLDPYCSVTYTLTKDGDVLKVRITGDILAQTSPWVSPVWNQRLEHLFLRVQCTPRSAPVEMELADSLGVTIEVLRSRVLTSVLLTPYERWLKSPCGLQPIHEIHAGFKSVNISTARIRLNGDTREIAAGPF